MELMCTLCEQMDTRGIVAQWNYWLLLVITIRITWAR